MENESKISIFFFFSIHTDVTFEIFHKLQDMQKYE